MHRNRLMRNMLAVVLATGCFMAIVGAFWWQDVRYQLPTPKPAALVQMPLGDKVALPKVLLAYQGKPLLLHFFNPDCPCSRFNLAHVRELQHRYGNELRIVAVVQGTEAASDLPIPAIADPCGGIAAQLGVYSTPQAVLLTADGRLFYRGNYNRSRFCSDSATAFAQQAIEALRTDAGQHVAVAANPDAITAYGCPLPSDVRSDSTWLDQLLVFRKM